jgi:beta-galactosidase
LGQFLWTGIDYLGEAGQFPNRNSTSGLIDLAGNKKPEYYFRQSLWSDKPMVYIGTTDHLKDNSPVNLWAHKRVEPVWNWKTGQPVLVSVFTNCDEVTLFLNDRSLGSRKMSGVGSRTLTWELPFERGVLRAVASTGGREMADCELRSSGPPFMLEAVSDTNEIKANREDIAQIFLTLCDKDGNVVYTGDNEITCHISGPVRLLGMEDSNPDNIEDYKDNNQHAYHGKLLIYIQALDKTGRAEILFSSPGLEPASIVLDVVK